MEGFGRGNSICMFSVTHSVCVGFDFSRDYERGELWKKWGDGWFR